MGGVAGHMAHLSEDTDLTFNEIVSILGKVANAEIDNATEKVDGQNLFDPLKRLALTLAEQIARAELTHNDESIRRFIERSIAEIEPSQLTKLVLHVSTAWHERLQSEPLQTVVQNYEVRVDDKLSVGSIRLTIQDTTIEDLIERRIGQLSEQLFTPSPISEDQQLLFPEEGDDGFVIPGDFAEVEVDDIFFNAPKE